MVHGQWIRGCSATGRGGRVDAHLQALTRGPVSERNRAFLFFNPSWGGTWDTTAGTAGTSQPTGVRLLFNKLLLDEPSTGKASIRQSAGVDQWPDRDVANVEAVSSNLTVRSTLGMPVRKHWGALVCMCSACWPCAATDLVHRVGSRIGHSQSGSSMPLWHSW